MVNKIVFKKENFIPERLSNTDLSVFVPVGINIVTFNGVDCVSLAGFRQWKGCSRQAVSNAISKKRLTVFKENKIKYVPINDEKNLNWQPGDGTGRPKVNE